MRYSLCCPPAAIPHNVPSTGFVLPSLTQASVDVEALFSRISETSRGLVIASISAVRAAVTDINNQEPSADVSRLPFSGSSLSQSTECFSTHSGTILAQSSTGSRSFRLSLPVSKENCRTTRTLCSRSMDRLCDLRLLT